MFLNQFREEYRKEILEFSYQSLLFVSNNTYPSAYRKETFAFKWLKGIYDGIDYVTMLLSYQGDHVTTSTVE